MPTQRLSSRLGSYLKFPSIIGRAIDLRKGAEIDEKALIGLIRETHFTGFPPQPDTITCRHVGAMSGLRQECELGLIFRSSILRNSLEKQTGSPLQLKIRLRFRAAQIEDTRLFMKRISRHALFVIPLAALLVAAPSLFNAGKLLSYDQAYAGKGGNGGGKGNGGNANGGNRGNGGQGASAGGQGKSAGQNKSASLEGGSTTKGNGKGKGNISSQLGALNAAHASPKALANASPNSRVGKIAAYKAATEASTQADEAAAAAVAAAIAASPSAQSAIAASDQADANLATAQQALDDLKADPNATPEAIAAAEQAVADATTAAADAQAAEEQAKADAVAADPAAQAALAEAEAAHQAETDALNAAANKTPVSAEAKAALDALLEGK